MDISTHHRSGAGSQGSALPTNDYVEEAKQLDEEDLSTMQVDFVHVRRYDEKLADTIRMEYFRSGDRSFARARAVNCGFERTLLWKRCCFCCVGCDSKRSSTGASHRN